MFKIAVDSHGSLGLKDALSTRVTTKEMITSCMLSFRMSYLAKSAYKRQSLHAEVYE